MDATDLITISRTRRLAESGDARRIRRAARLSISEVAEALQTSEENVARWERGERSPRGPAALEYGALLDRLVGSTNTDDGDDAE